jgi:hypothetical protein
MKGQIGMYVIRNDGRKVEKQIGKLNLILDTEKTFTTTSKEVVDAFSGLPGVTVTERPAAQGEKPTVGDVKDIRDVKDAKEV